jgi:hypothetical protein
VIEGISFRRPKADRLEVYVATRQKKGTFCGLRFNSIGMEG